ncbi:PASTA domain-containing protein [Candidatus Aerophobetes bacterium]|nr:PASTA domain-containing protein [Candidatus Aerophobetes bacterium]
MWLKSLLKGALIIICLWGLAIGVFVLTLRILVPVEKIEVPSITGKDVKEAAILLGERDLALKVVGRRYSSEIPRDMVISQVPFPGIKVSKNRVVEVVISEGSKVVAIPSLKGKELREAEIYLSQKGLEIRDIGYVYVDYPPGKVFSQNPPPLTEVDRKEGVGLLVSLGKKEPAFYLPDFQGKRVEEVRNFFEKLPLKIGRIKESPLKGEEGIVISQFPPPGSKVDRESFIELTVSSFYEEKKIRPLKNKLFLSFARVPLGFEKREIKVVIEDSKGKRTISYGKREPGERVGIITEVKGEGEIRIYAGDELVKMEKIDQ